MLNARLFKELSLIYTSSEAVIDSVVFGSFFKPWKLIILEYCVCILVLMVGNKDYTLLGNNPRIGYPTEFAGKATPR